jgi:preprotein translocase subunit SecA
MYEKLSGMTGTALTNAEEFDSVYKLDVVVIPTNKPMIRKNLADRIYKNEAGKFRAIIKEIKERHEKGQPMLVGTISIEKNELLGALLRKEGIHCEILNAKQHEREGAIIAQAGKSGAITVATNMAGRGVDIILGGNPSSSDEAQKIREVGGIHVIGTERHEARRIDNQLRGRSGRQGDPGSSQFFVSLEDELMRRFGGDRIKKMMETLGVPEDQPIENKFISNAIEKAQARIEGFNFDIRKHVLEYDDVMNKHRDVIYRMRKEILAASDEEVKKKIEELLNDEELKQYKEKQLGEKELRGLERFVMLNVIDNFWMAHLDNMSHLRESVGLRAYGQRDPLVEYKNEGHRLFKKLLEDIDFAIGETLLRAEFRKSPIQRRTEAGSKNKVGRNDPCSCGSGKKYKKCHGQ